ncbi:site-specific integrase [Streptomyces sp. 8N706]|uniref:site-specific integrase n=1 Tax=Streptomyces sp. 8N706 TaxID=3457416 RepID=UPI003FD2AB92
MSTTTMWRMIRRAAEGLVATDPRFAKVKFAAHDFRRLFATELVNNGLPIHIGAALLGHLNIQTTRGYVSVFDEDVVRYYQQFLDRRRAERPESEYRKLTEAEWTEFNEYFDKRRVELGSCGRPYGTPCQHEHACIRCPMLSINPKMLPRLDELEEDLLARRERAVAGDRRGEIDGLDLTSPSCAASASRPGASPEAVRSPSGFPWFLIKSGAATKWTVRGDEKRGDCLPGPPSSGMVRRHSIEAFDGEPSRSGFLVSEPGRSSAPCL